MRELLLSVSRKLLPSCRVGYILINLLKTIMWSNRKAGWEPRMHYFPASQPCNVASMASLHISSKFLCLIASFSNMASDNTTAVAPALMYLLIESVNSQHSFPAHVLRDSEKNRHGYGTNTKWHTKPFQSRRQEITETRLKYI